jgi:hypothetical protein
MGAFGGAYFVYLIFRIRNRHCMKAYAKKVILNQYVVMHIKLILMMVIVLLLLFVVVAAVVVYRNENFTLQ